MKANTKWSGKQDKQSHKEITYWRKRWHKNLWHEKDFTFILCKFHSFTEKLKPLQCRVSSLLKIPSLNYQLHFNLYKNNLYLTLNSKPNWTLKIETITITFLMHISNGDRCVKYGRGFYNWTCSQQNPCLHFSKIISSSLKSAFETDDSGNKIVDFWKNDLWRYFKFSQPMITV